MAGNWIKTHRSLWTGLFTQVSPQGFNFCKVLFVCSPKDSFEIFMKFWFISDQTFKSLIWHLKWLCFPDYVEHSDKWWTKFSNVDCSYKKWGDFKMFFFFFLVNSLNLLHLVNIKSYFLLLNHNGLWLGSLSCMHSCRKIPSWSGQTWPEDVEGELPLCHELLARHRGSKRQEYEKWKQCIQDVSHSFSIGKSSQERYCMFTYSLIRGALMLLL